MVQLRRGVRTVRRGPDEVQIGTDPRWAVRLAGLDGPTVERLLAAGDRPLEPLLPPDVIDQLGTAGLVRETPTRRHPLPTGTTADARAGALAGDGDERALIRRRARATVHVVGLGRVGAVAASALVAGGVGALLLDDDRPVGAEDLGFGVQPADLGARRSDVLGRLVAAQAPHVRVRRPGSARRPDVVLTVATDVADPTRALRLMTADVPHLPVVVREADAVVGPFVVPGDGPCVRCVELHRADVDPAWPRVLAGLASGTGPDGVPGALAAVVGGLAAAEVLRHLDGGRPCTRGHQYEVALPSAEPRLRRWAAHPDCGCAALPV